MIKNIINYYPRVYVENGGVTSAMWKYIDAYKKDHVNSHVAFGEKLYKKQSLEVKKSNKNKGKTLFIWEI